MVMSVLNLFQKFCRKISIAEKDTLIMRKIHFLLVLNVKKENDFNNFYHVLKYDPNSV